MIHNIVNTVKYQQMKFGFLPTYSMLYSNTLRTVPIEFFYFYFNILLEKQQGSQEASPKQRGGW